MIYFLIPVYNEALNLQLLAENLKNSIPSQEKFFVFVDDGSIDNSSTIITKEFYGFDYIILGDGKNHGPGFSFNLGFEWILEHSHDITDKIVTMEADNTSDIELLDKMIIISDLDYDLVLASVYAQGGGFQKTNFFRRFISFIANMVFRSIFNIKILTLSSFYRVYKISLIGEIKSKYINIISESGFISMLEILIKAIKVNAKIIEVPMKLMSANRKGKSGMKIMKNTLSYLRFLFFKKPKEKRI